MLIWILLGSDKHPSTHPVLWMLVKFEYYIGLELIYSREIKTLIQVVAMR